MRIFRCSIVAGLCLLLGACATTANYEMLLGRWTGRSEAELVSQWGPPDNSYTLDAHSKVISYLADNSYVRDGMDSLVPRTVTRWRNGVAYTDTILVPLASSPRYVPLKCKTIFTITDGKVTAWNWQGNDCRATERESREDSPKHGS